MEGTAREVFFPEKHHPGRMCQSDFTHMDKLGVTINQQPFDHLIFHFVFTYSNWETGSICFSESFESLSEGLQKALWKLRGVPIVHQTDRLSTAVNKTNNPEEFTRRYQALLKHYGLLGRKIQASKPNENGDVEQRHRRFKRAVDQALMLRESRDFASRGEYEEFFKEAVLAAQYWAAGPIFRRTAGFAAFTSSKAGILPRAGFWNAPKTCWPLAIPAAARRIRPNVT